MRKFSAQIAFPEMADKLAIDLIVTGLCNQTHVIRDISGKISMLRDLIHLLECGLSDLPDERAFRRAR